MATADWSGRSGASLANTYSTSNGITVEGLAEFRKQLKRVGPTWPKELAAAHKQVAVDAQRYARQAARGYGGVQRKSANAIRGNASVKEARLQIRPTSSTAMARTAFWGAKKRTGWYAKLDAPTGKQQHPEWVGSSWKVADSNEGPYAINAALDFHMEELLATYMAAVDRIASEAFPN